MIYIMIIENDGMLKRRRTMILSLTRALKRRMARLGEEVGVMSEDKQAGTILAELVEINCKLDIIIREESNG